MNPSATNSENMAATSDYEEELQVPFSSLIGTHLMSNSSPSVSSVASNKVNYVEMHGRRYGGILATPCWRPNDEKEAYQLKIGHAIYTLLLNGKLGLAPVPSNPHLVLDVGAGTGSWAIEFGRRFPSAKVVGVDQAPVQPMFVPPNVEFQLDDVQLDWTFEESSFDYIHVSCLLGAIDDWQKLWREIFRCARPGGWVENLEFSIDFKCKNGDAHSQYLLHKWSEIFREAGNRTGKTFQTNAKQDIIGAGFADVTEEKYEVPIGEWDRSSKKQLILGSYATEMTAFGLEGFALHLLKEVLSWDQEAISEFLSEIQQTLLNNKYCPYFEVTVVYGRKTVS